MMVNSSYNFNFSIYILYIDKVGLPDNFNRPNRDLQRNFGCVRGRKPEDVPR